ncbi:MULTISPECIES: hypothetical protein [unclassified Mesorhizobium]|uniref:hypothetical protein n=1 Tax=unclassified Mesorhizobium TaxID=325217 RepID=UPI001CCF8C96|nr:MULTISPECIES: hypothetical protein [unclassified Mesorhizobium]MBZ9768153.1 hypothetical protein [Mesorhizobium sp. CA6]MBZ9862123.1 hypothetical protein [Mesorhizobium sp. CA12]
MALRAGIDAGRSGSGIYAVAAVAFSYGRAKKANKQWQRLLDGRTFHMTHLNARKGDFEGIDDRKKKQIMHGIVEIIKNNASYIVCTSYDDSTIEEKFPKLSNNEKAVDEFLYRAFRTKYGPMIHMCMWALGDFANDGAMKRNHISYVLETGDDGQGGFIDYIRFLNSNKERQPVYKHVLEQYSLVKLIATPKEEMEGVFHAADFVAWEWARHVERQRQDLPMRKSLQALTSKIPALSDYYGLTLGDKNRIFCRHYAEKHANRLVKFLRETAEAKSEADIRAANAHWAETRF